MTTSLPHREHDRLELLRRLHLLDTPPEPEFDAITELAAAALGAPIVLVSLVDEHRQWFKSCIGLDVRQTGRQVSFCAHALHGEALLVVPDALQDSRFRHNPLVTGEPHIRFYAGAPLILEEGLAIGTLCVIDTQPRPGLSPQQAEVLRRLAALVVGQVRARTEGHRQRAVERLHRDVVDNIQEVVFQTDGRGRWTYLNRSWETLSGHAVAASLGRSALDFMDPRDRAHYRRRLGRVLAGEAATCREEVRHVTGGGAYAWVEVHARATRDLRGRVTGASGTLRDISAAKQAELALRGENAELERRVRERTRELERANARLRHTTLHDALTGLGNRTLFQQRLGAVLERPQPQALLAAVILIDCDRFKQLNDTLGHGAGDDLLRQLARRFEAEVAPPHLVTRFGGDEFGILLDGLGSAEEACAVARRLTRVTERPVPILGREWHVQASAGVVLLRGQYASVEAVVRDADIAMYRAKARRQDKVELFETTMHQALVARSRLEEELRQALRAGELHLHYQPIVRMSDGALHGLEALARWPHPVLGAVSPAEFIPVAEESGLIVDLDRSILERACEQFQRWRAQGLAGPALTLSANASPRQFLLPDFADFVRGTLKRTGLPPRQLQLEITESLMLEETPAVRGNLTALGELGVQLHIDDFGTGYSSLAYVQRLSASALKIDRSFVGRTGQDGPGEALVRAVLEMARALGMTVIAEGVETPQQRDWLQAAGCALAQGFLFSRPLDRAGVEALLHGVRAGEAL